MKLSILLSLFILTACSEMAIRGPASVEMEFFFGDIDPKASIVKAFPPQMDGKIFRKYFYLELKDAQGNYVDCEEREISLKQGSKRLPFKLERTLRGRYYVTLEGLDDSSVSKVSLSVRNIPLSKETKIFLKKADRNKSKIKVLKTERTGLHMQLVLKDSRGKPLELPTSPEIILEGLGEAENLEHMGEGVWEFDLHFPNTNTVIYISVRAHGTFLDSMYRVQHIEK